MHIPWPVEKYQNQQREMYGSNTVEYSGGEKEMGEVEMRPRRREDQQVAANKQEEHDIASTSGEWMAQ